MRVLSADCRRHENPDLAIFYRGGIAERRPIVFDLDECIRGA